MATPRAKLRSVEDELTRAEYEAWRPAIVAFYRSEGWHQSADNIERGFEFTPEYERTIRSLAAAFAARPVQKAKAA